jgi:hypothetical protein
MVHRALLVVFIGVGLDCLAHAAAPPAPVPQTGQTTCYGARDTVVSCSGTGQDGETRTGVPWPDSRFAENGDQAIVDRLTGLVRTRDANAAGGPKTWQGALDYVTTLNLENHLGRSDWRLPNINELKSLVDHSRHDPDLPGGDPFLNAQSMWYWSSTTNPVYTSGALTVGRQIKLMRFMPVSCDRGSVPLRCMPISGRGCSPAGRIG